MPGYETEPIPDSAIRAVGLNVLHRERGILALYGMWDEMPDQKISDV